MSTTVTARALGPWLGASLLAVVVGAALVGGTDQYVGAMPSLLLVAAVCGVATFLIFGAIGYCEEHPLHLLHKRIQAAGLAYGDAGEHLDAVARTIGLDV